ncbi:MAG TPA: DUF1707 domain-containing protein [Streptosporangiaceae bacterium]
MSRTDRDNAVDRLQTAYADARLDDAELADRTRQALQARTRGDLDAVLADLPGQGMGVVATAEPEPHRGVIGGCIGCCVGMVTGICRAIQRLAGGGPSR